MYRRRPGLVLAMGIGLGLVTAETISACSQHYRSSESVYAAAATEQAPVVRNQVPTIVDAENQCSLERLLEALDSKQAIFVGETHGRYDHHLNQLTVIRGLHERGVDLAVGMEFFQEPFQPYLDHYVAGKIDEKTLLKKTEYFERWRFDYRLYRDILTYARDNGIPLIALNAPSELVAQVSEKGIAGLGPDDRVRLPQDLRPARSAYEDRLRPIFAMHGKTSEERFRRFVDVQLLWDEHMARVARDYLVANPIKMLVILAGSGHVAYPDAIPGRLARMTKGESAVVVTGDRERFAEESVDFVFAEREIALDPPGRLGVELEGADSVVKIREVRTAGPADIAGLRPGDQMLRINGEQVQAVEDVRLALLDKRPGDAVWVEVASGSKPDPGGRYERLVRLL